VSDSSFATPGRTDVGVCEAGQARRVDAIRGERDGESDIRKTGGSPTCGADLALNRQSNGARNPVKIKRLEHVEGGSDVITHLLSSKTKSSMTKYRSPIFAIFLEVNRRWDGYRGSVPMQQAIALLLISN
jgi:hypothetical protein